MPSTNKKLKRSVQTPEAHIASLQAEVVHLRGVVDAFKCKNEFIARPGRPTMIVKIGDVQQKWLPSPRHYAATTRSIKAAKLDEKYNIILAHAFTTFELQD